MLLEVFEVEQLQRDPGLAPFGMGVGVIGERAGRSGGGRRAVEPRLHGVIGQGLDLRPVQPGKGGPAEDSGRRPKTDGETGRDLPVAPAQGPLLAKNLTDLLHG